MKEVEKKHKQLFFNVLDKKSAFWAQVSVKCLVCSASEKAVSSVDDGQQRKMLNIKSHINQHYKLFCAAISFRDSPIIFSLYSYFLKPISAVSKQKVFTLSIN